MTRYLLILTLVFPILGCENCGSDNNATSSTKIDKPHRYYSKGALVVKTMKEGVFYLGEGSNRQIPVDTFLAMSDRYENLDDLLAQLPPAPVIFNSKKRVDIIDEQGLLQPLSDVEKQAILDIARDKKGAE